MIKISVIEIQQFLIFGVPSSLLGGKNAFISEGERFGWDIIHVFFLVIPILCWEGIMPPYLKVNSLVGI